MSMVVNSGESGFSLVELIISMAVTLVLISSAGTLLADAFDIRTRENRKSDALSDAQRALNMMSREIGNSGYGLTNNGIVAADSGGAAAATTSSIRVRANLDGSADGTAQANEDVTYVYQAANSALVRYDRATDTTEVLADGLPPLANGVAPVQFSFLARNAAGNLVASTPAAAEAVRLSLTATVNRVKANQPATPVVVTSNITLRNAIMGQY